MKQSSVEWLYDRFVFVGYAIPSEWKEQVKEMHKNEILDAFVDGYEYREMCETRPNKFSSTKPLDYYNETFKDIPLK